ncbi:MAG TPA: phage portal protein [Pontiellaceae bacterium]|nr:phage portal protein [Pontiellaceae bacterium]
MSRNYAFGRPSRTADDFFSGSLSADQAVFGSLYAMRNRARQLERDDSHVRKFLIMAKTSIIGAKGIRLQSKAGDFIKGQFYPSRFDQDLIETAFEDFSKSWNFSIDGKLDRRRFAQVAIQRVLVDGECIIRRHRGAGMYGIQNQLIDAELLDHTLNQPASSNRNEIRMGVEIDANGKPLAYHFLEEAPPAWMGTAVSTANRKRIPANDINHIFIQERPGQTRGVTWLAPTGLRARMLDGIETAVTVGYRVAASKMGFFRPGENYEGEEIETADIPSDVTPGELNLLPKGIEFQSFDAGYPNAEFDGFKKSIVREIAGGLGVSYPELGNDFGGVSYSAGQIGVHSDAALWSDLQQFWMDSFEEPNFREFLLMSITSGELQLPLSKLRKFQNVRFQPQRRKHIDPLKTHNAQRIALGDMSRSPFDIAAENGADFEDVIDETKAAIEMLKAAGLPVPESWASGKALSTIIEEPPAT